MAKVHITFFKKGGGEGRGRRPSTLSCHFEVCVHLVLGGWGGGPQNRRDMSEAAAGLHERDRRGKDSLPLPSSPRRRCVESIEDGGLTDGSPRGDSPSDGNRRGKKSPKCRVKLYFLLVREGVTLFHFSVIWATESVLNVRSPNPTVHFHLRRITGGVLV